MNIVSSIDDICDDWKENTTFSQYGNLIATYQVYVRGIVSDEEITSFHPTEPLVIRNYASGSTLPDIVLVLVDQIGTYPAGNPDVDVVRASIPSLDGFSNPTTIPLVDGEGSVTGKVAFKYPGNYTFTIKFDQAFIESSLTLILEVRNCSMGETTVGKGLMCHVCNEDTFNFTPESETGCLSCPDNANCTTSFIAPNNGYWHQFPCSTHIQKCLTLKACDFNDREASLYKFSQDKLDCNFNDTEIRKYEIAQCRQVYRFLG